METAYDHIQEEVLKTDEKGRPAASPAPSADAPPEANLNTELQDAYRTFSSSAWGVRLGGFLGTVRRQGESYYQSARDEASIASEEAIKGFTDLKSSIVSRARGLSLGDDAAPAAPTTATTDSTADVPTSPTGAPEAVAAITPTRASDAPTSADPGAETDGFISRFRAEADKRLREIQRAEDAADEALLKFGTNVSNFLRDAVTVAPPSLEDEDEIYGEGQEKGERGTKVLFESKDAEGRRVIHTTRLDAQLHVIHCSLDSFTKDPASLEWAKWQKDFDVETKTDAIAADLEKYEDLRRAMERLVPEMVEYGAFWARYYFLRMVAASEEQRRKEMLKGRILCTRRFPTQKGETSC